MSGVDSVSSRDEDLKRMQTLEQELSVLNEKHISQTKELSIVKSEKDELSGKSKQMYASFTELQSQLKRSEEKVGEQKQILTRLEAKKEQDEKELSEKLNQLSESRKSLEDEKQRIRKEDEEAKQRKEEEKHRIWAEHEQIAINKLKELCDRSSYSFRYFDNTNLPASFDGKLKPDFLIEFMDQYIIFDAKMTKPDSANTLQNYLKNQAKSTAKKIKESNNAAEIYKTVYFVVPAESEIKENSLFEEGIQFYIIPVNAIEPILAAFKKISYYDSIEQIDPLERENIVQLIAAYDQHISHQNAVNILSSLMGVKVSELKNNLSSDLQAEVSAKRQKIRIDNFKPTDLKRLIENPAEQVKQMQEMIGEQKPKIENKDLSDAQDSLF